VRQLIGRHGVTFTNSFDTTPLCCPARVSYLTGQYAHNHGVLFNSGPHGGYPAFRSQSTTFPAALHATGYYTGHIGKYLNAYAPTLGTPPGWDDFYVTWGARTYNYYGLQIAHNGTIGRLDASEKNYSTDVFARLATRFIRRRAGRGPFLLNVAFLAPHSAGNLDHTMRHEPLPILSDPHEIDYRLAVPPRRYRGRFRHLPLPHPASFDQPLSQDQPRFLRFSPLFRRFTRRDVADITARYRSRLESLLTIDDATVAIIRALRATNQLAKTLVVFTSDNGFFNGEHRIRAGKYYAYDPATRVPLLMRGPGIPEGITRTAPVALIDLAPTILAAAGVRPLRPPDGISLFRVIANDRLFRRRPLLVETPQNPVYPISYSALRTTRYLFVRYSTGETELFDLRRDPAEIRNLAATPHGRLLERSLKLELKRLQRCAGPSCSTPG
jgi:N-acetylglucosamine-6-sulfatase